MARNPIPAAFPSLMLQTQRAFQGATTIGSAIPLLINTAALIGADRDNLKSSQAAYQSATAAQTGLNETLRLAKAEAITFGINARDVLKYYFGRTYSQAWRAAGFINSLAVPQDESGIHTLLEALQVYFTANPTQENADLEVTAARAGTLLAAMNTARSAIDNQKNLANAKRIDRDAKRDAVKKRLSGLCKELVQRLTPLDPRWRDFGFNLPGAPSVPAVPKNVVAQATVPGQLLITSNTSATAAGYRFYYQRPILDPEPLFAGSAVDPLFIITGLTPGQSYFVYVSATNAGGESELSEPASAVVTLAAAA